MSDKDKLSHVEHLSDGGMMCRSCGGIVGEDGYAEDLAEHGDGGGLKEEEEGSGEEGSSTDQHESTERMRGAAFAAALRRGGK